MDDQQLKSRLTSLDGKGYKAYKSIKGTFNYPKFELMIDHVQGDPFAAASKLRVKLNHTTTKYPKQWFSNASRRIALQDYVTRVFFGKSQTKSQSDKLRHHLRHQPLWVGPTIGGRTG